MASASNDMRPFWYPSPNYTEGRNGYRVEAIVIHISEGSLESMRSWFQNDASDVSAHYGIDKDADLDQYVDECDTAWHAGRMHSPTWALLKPGVNPNKYTIGIEHALRQGDSWPKDMIERSAQLIAEIHVRHRVPIDEQHVVGHHRIFARKPHCPTPNSIVKDLIRLAQEKLR